MARSKFKRDAEKCDGRQFLRLPLVVLESPGYRQASHTARSLLLDIAMQFTGNNNGKLTACAKYLNAKGWRSNDTIVRARRELIDCGLLIETRKGGWPNTAAWYALAWRDLDHGVGLDISPQHFRRGAYMQPEVAPKAKRNSGTKNASPTPADGAQCNSTAPAHGARAPPQAPAHGVMRGGLSHWPVPAGGAYLEIPSA